MRVIGTAGHVDHGKSALIEALTGKHPDRLKEEQAREMTIELGFGWAKLPGGEEIGIVDVPGHRDFIENMLAGIGGIDAALLVIAADEGIMPQTQEHLAILDLLQISGGLIVLTKTDLASDSGWLDLLEADIRSAVSGTTLQAAPILRVSAKHKTGLTELLHALETILQNQPPRPDLNRPRLPIDRVFSLSGFGTVVTGTLLNGKFSIGDEVLILPSAQTGRIRGLQTHQKKTETVFPGSRAAINLSGIETEALQRGEVVVMKEPLHYQATRRVDAHLRLLNTTSAPLKHAAEVKLFVGASETMATLRLLDIEEAASGKNCWIQLELREPIVAARGDRYILRRPSPSETLGGGVIVDPQPKSRHKRFDAAILQALEALLQGKPADVLLEAALTLQAAPLKEIVSYSRLESTSAAEALKELFEAGSLIALEVGEISIDSAMLVIPLARWNLVTKRFLEIVNSHHTNFPLRAGIPREELKSKLGLNAKIYNACLSLLLKEQVLAETAQLIKNARHAIRFTEREQVQVQALMRAFEAQPFSPPSVKEAQAIAGAEIFQALIALDELTLVSTEVVFRKPDYQKMSEIIHDILKRQGAITLAEARDALTTSRKYAQAFLEHLDAVGITTRAGDARKLRQPA